MSESSHDNVTVKNLGVQCPGCFHSTAGECYMNLLHRGGHGYVNFKTKGKKENHVMCSMTFTPPGKENTGVNSPTESRKSCFPGSTVSLWCIQVCKYHEFVFDVLQETICRFHTNSFGRSQKGQRNSYYPPHPHFTQWLRHSPGV